MTDGSKGRHAQLWDDETFRKRVAECAAKKGMGPRDAMREIGFTSDYANREMNMRNSNQVMVLADFFGVSPAWLAGWDDEPPRRVFVSHNRREAAEVQELITKAYRDWLSRLIIDLVKTAQDDARAERMTAMEFQLSERPEPSTASGGSETSG